MKSKVIVAVAILCSGCAGSVTTVSPIQGRNGYAEENIQFTVSNNGGFDEGNQITAVTSGGEIFNGSVAYEKVTTASDYSTTEYYSKKERKKLKAAGLDSHSHTYDETVSETSYGPTAHAVLISNRGRSMNCTFTLHTPENGLIWGGGIGTCATSDGKTIPVNIIAKPMF